MAIPVTPLIGCDVFVPDSTGRVLLIRRADNGFWALPGGFNDVGETPLECAVRECREETGLSVRVRRLLGVFSSRRYKQVNYPYPGAYAHILFLAYPVDGGAAASAEAREVGFFGEMELPAMSDGHDVRVAVGFAALREPDAAAHFE
jgi:ADP-ribose pyrophosphatase YjhB (NUDIX family)